MLHPPSPGTDREYIVEIYNAVQGIQARILELCVIADHNSARLDHLESWRNRIAGGLVVIGLLASAVLGRLLFGGP